MSRVGRHLGVLTLLGFFSACSMDHGAWPTLPTTTRSQPAPTPPPVPGFPPISGPARVFESVSGSPPWTRFVLYDRGTFQLQYRGGFQLGGTYSQANTIITFTFPGYTGGADGATASLMGDLLDVRFNDTMQQSDFVNEVFRLVP
jgi:hypothetical protein